MKEAAVPGYRLSRSRFSTKVLTSLGLMGLLLGLLSAVAITLAKTGISPRSVESYYLGTSHISSTSKTELSGLLETSSPRPFAELAEVTHLHLMGGSLMLFLLCHLLAVCDINDRLRVTLYVGTFISFLSTFTLPWLIVYLAPQFSLLYAPSIISFLLFLIALCLIPLREMWFTKNGLKAALSPVRDAVRLKAVNES